MIILICKFSKHINSKSYDSKSYECKKVDLMLIAHK